MPFKLKQILHYTFKCMYTVHNPVTFCHFVFNVFNSTINLKFIFVSICNSQISGYIDNVIDHDLLKVFMKRKSFYTLVNEQQKMITSAQFFFACKGLMTALEFTVCFSYCRINQWNFRTKKKLKRKVQLIHQNGFQLEPQISRPFFLYLKLDCCQVL